MGLFHLGILMMTTRIQDAQTNGLNVTELIERHEKADWAEMEDYDREQNVQAIAKGHRVCSRFIVEPWGPIWVITEADRSVTTVLLPSEY